MESNETYKKMTVVADDFSDEDSIGYKIHCDTLADMIRSVESRGSFTIGIYGEWGQGKTSMLRQIKKGLDEANQKNNRNNILTTWFNPWQFDSDEPLIVPFFHTFIASLRNLKEKLEKRSGTEVFLNKVDRFIQKVAHVPVALAYGLEGEIRIPLLLKSKFSFQKAIDESRKIEKQIDGSSNEPGYEEAIERYESLYYDLIRKLQDAVNDFGVKTVVFIDDLDRCLPEKAIQLLEGLKVLLDLKNFVFVIGVAREIIERGVRVRYKELYLSGSDDLPFIDQEYLDKIIQFPISIPPADPERLKSHLIKDHMKGLEKAEPYIDLIMNSLPNNPRTLKRFINVISYSIAVAEKKERAEENSDKFLPELLIKLSLLAFSFPGLYRQLIEYPHHLIHLQRALKEYDAGREGMNIEDAEKGPQVVKTEIPIVDQWLDDKYLQRLNEVLKCVERKFNNETVMDIGFKDDEEVRRYIYMLASALAPETEKEKKRIESRSLKKEMDGRMKKIPAGKFLMGEGTDQHEEEVNEFEMDMYPVTQSLYNEVMNDNPGRFKGDDRPVESVSWYDAVKFCNRLSEKTKLTPVYKIEGGNVEWIRDGSGYRLPTEMEWEYACRAGTTGDRYSDDLNKIAWYDGNSDINTHGVGQKEANKWGLYDMLGNVWEWCFDFYDDSEAFPVARGGSWGFSAEYCRCAFRYSFFPYFRYSSLGFRCARTVSL